MNLLVPGLLNLRKALKVLWNLDAVMKQGIDRLRMNRMPMPLGHDRV